MSWLNDNGKLSWNPGTWPVLGDPGLGHGLDGPLSGAAGDPVNDGGYQSVPGKYGPATGAPVANSTSANGSAAGWGSGLQPPWVGKPPGTPLPDGWHAPNLVRDPATGMWIDPATNRVYTDAAGTKQVTDPSVAVQVAHNFAAASAANAQAAKYAGDFSQTFDKQMSLADMLNNTITNVNAPSVAQEQEKQALNANEATQLSNAAGVSGQNAVIGRTTAANNIAGLDANAAQTAGLTRATEVSNAEKGLGDVLNSASSGASGMYSTAGGLGLNYNTIAGNEQLGGNSNATAIRNQNIGLVQAGVTGVGAGFGSGATSGTGGGSGGSGFGSAGAPTGTASDSQFTAPTSDDGVATANYGQQVQPLGFTNRSLMSDERMKHDIYAETNGDEESFANALQPKSFKYDEDEEGEPRRHGVMAQDVERSKIGKSFMGTREDGMKGMDVAQGLGAALSLLGYLHGKIEKLEARGG